MAVLAQAYLHLSPYRVPRSSLFELGSFTLDRSIRAAKDIYGGNVQIDVRIEEGSAKTWATVFGAITAVHVGYGVVADYKGFKESIVELCSDAGKFGDVICGDVAKKAGATEGQIFRYERRRKTPGKIGKLLDRLEIVDELQSQGKLSKAELLKQITAARAELENIERGLEQKDRDAFGDFLIFQNLPPLRDPARKKQRRDASTAAIAPRRDDTDLFAVPETEGLSAAPPDQKSRLVYHNTAFVPAK